MPVPTAIILILAAAALASALTWLVRRQAATLGLVQTPNHRSSHVVPTPRGGGVGFIAPALLFGLLVIPQAGFEAGAILLVTLGFTVLGLADDLKDLSARARFPLQALLALLFLAVYPALPELRIAGLEIGGVLLASILLLGFAWWVNLFNFMDGIDGIAACQAIFMLAAAALFSASAAQGDLLWWWLPVSAAAVCGFLYWNFPPARIFMGDSGSNGLAFLIAGLAIATVARGWLDYGQWAILAAVFVVDATATLVRRMVAGERWFAPHRQHAYQHLSRRWRSHRRVTLAYVALNLVFIAPMAYAAGEIDAEWTIVVLTYLPLAGLALLLDAGRREDG